jgi:hypothetical protein
LCLLHAPRGPFYSPKATRSHWRPTRKVKVAFCRVAHRTVRCTTGQPLFMSGARSPSYFGAYDHCRFVAVGAPDTVRCTPDSPVPPARPDSLGRAVLGRPGTTQENRLKARPDTKYIGPCQHDTNTGLGWALIFSPSCRPARQRRGR